MSFWINTFMIILQYKNHSGISLIMIYMEIFLTAFTYIHYGALNIISLIIYLLPFYRLFVEKS